MSRALIACLLVACHTPSPFDFRGTAQECAFHVPGGSTGEQEVLFVLDTSNADPTLQARQAAQLEQLVEHMVLIDAQFSTWMRIGVVSADAITGGHLQGGCGIVDGRPFIEYRRGVLSNVEPGVRLGAVARCMAESLVPGKSPQPMTMAAQVLSSQQLKERDFHVRRAWTAVYFILGAAYPEDARPLTALAETGEARFMFGSVAPPSPSLDPIVRSSFSHVQLPVSASDWSPLVDPLFLITSTERIPSCLWIPPADPDHPLFAIEEWTYNAVHEPTVRRLPSCSESRGLLPCWSLDAVAKCESGWQLNVQRPLNEHASYPEIAVRYDCALTWSF